jgi:hypothetical protein
MKVKIVFDDWQDRQRQSIYTTDAGVRLSMGDFHSGSTFDAEIFLDQDQEYEMKRALMCSCVPVFYVSWP